MVVGRLFLCNQNERHKDSSYLFFIYIKISLTNSNEFSPIDESDAAHYEIFIWWEVEFCHEATKPSKMQFN